MKRKKWKYVKVVFKDNINVLIGNTVFILSFKNKYHNFIKNRVIYAVNVIRFCHDIAVV